MAARRSYLQLVCILLLLVAQYGALTHAVWHAHGRVPAPLHTGTGPANTQDYGAAGDGQLPSPSRLCGFDLAFGEVLGGVHGVCLDFVAVDPDARREAQSMRARHSVEPVSALSRGPPALL